MRINILIISSAILLASCSKTDTEIHNIAAATCSIISEATKNDASFRVKEVNLAREKMELEPYLDGDKLIIEAIENGLCIELVEVIKN